MSRPTVLSRPDSLLLPTLLSGVFITILDFFIVNVAIPTIRADLRAGPDTVEWIVAGYGLAFGSGLVLGGRLGDRFGRRRVFATGLAAFTLASLACGIAGTPGQLVAARVAQGAAAALLVPQVLAVIRTSFEGERQARAINLYATTMGLAAVFGQLVGGVLIRLDPAGLDWRACFLINVPIGIAALALTMRAVPESRAASAGQPDATSGRRTNTASARQTGTAPGGQFDAASGERIGTASAGRTGTAPGGQIGTASGERTGTAPGGRIDLAGAGLITLALIGVLLPLIEGREHGWPAWTWVSFAVAGFLLFAYARRPHPDPLIDPALFRSPAVAVGLLAQLAFTMTMAGYFLIFALYAQQGRGLGALGAGLLFAPIGVGYLAASMLAPRFTARLGRQTIALGGVVRAGSLAVLLVLVAANAPYAVLGPVLAIDGFGMGLALAPIMGTVLSRVEARHAGQAAGLLTTTQQVGGALGVGIIGVVFFGSLDGGVPEAFRHGLVYLIGVSLFLALVVQLLPARR